MALVLEFNPTYEAQLERALARLRRLSTAAGQRATRQRIERVAGLLGRLRRELVAILTPAEAAKAEPALARLEQLATNRRRQVPARRRPGRPEAPSAAAFAELEDLAREDGRTRQATARDVARIAVTWPRAERIAIFGAADEDTIRQHVYDRMRQSHDPHIRAILAYVFATERVLDVLNGRPTKTR